MNRLCTRLLPFTLIAAIGLLALSACKDDFDPIIRAQISVSPNPVQFVQSEIGIEEERILQIENTSPAELIITRIALTQNPDSVFTLNLLANEAPTAEAPLRIEAGERTSIIVTFTRPAAQQYEGALVITSNAQVPNLNVPLQTAQSAAVIATDPRDLVFGRVRLDTTSTRTLGIRNTGDAPLVINEIIGGFANPALAFTPDGEAENPISALQFPLTLQPGNENEVFLDVSCSPTSDGSISGDIVIRAPDAINSVDGNYVVRVTCNGPEPCLEVRDTIGRVNEDGIDFGFASIGARNSRNLTVNNCATTDGGEALIVDSIDLTEDPDDKYALNLEGLEFPLELAPGAGRPFSMIYEPTANETNTAVVTFRSNDQFQDPLDVDVIGVGTDNEPPIAALRCRITNVEPTPFTSEDFTTIPFVNALCDTEGSSDPDGDAIVAWEWEIIRPNDPLPLVRDTQEVEFSINAVGEYDVRVWVIDERGARSEMPAELTITSTPESEILCRLRWTHRFGGTEDSVDPQCRPGQCADGCGVDLDIHLINSTQGGWFSSSAVYFGGLNRIWPDGSEGSLDYDVLFGIGPESASVKRPTTGITYSCGVHYWNSYGWGEYADATMEIYVFGALIGSPERRLNSTGQFWPGVSINWNGTNTSASDIFLSDTVYDSVCDAPNSVEPCTVTAGQNTANRCW